MRVSTCCGAVMTVGGSGTTHYYVCAKCQRSCESMAADGKAKSSPAEGLAMGNGSLNKLEVDYGFKLACRRTSPTTSTARYGWTRAALLKTQRLLR